MRSRLVTSLILVGAIGALLAQPAVVQAQEAVLSGTVTDSTGSVMPGVLVRAVHEASGNSFEAVTDTRGLYRIPVRSGGYVITAQGREYARRGDAVDEPAVVVIEGLPPIRSIA